MKKTYLKSLYTLSVACLFFQISHGTCMEEERKERKEGKDFVRLFFESAYDRAIGGPPPRPSLPESLHDKQNQAPLLSKQPLALHKLLDETLEKQKELNIAHEARERDLLSQVREKIEEFDRLKEMYDKIKEENEQLEQEKILDKELQEELLEKQKELDIAHEARERDLLRQASEKEKELNILKEMQGKIKEQKEQAEENYRRTAEEKKQIKIAKKEMEIKLQKDIGEKKEKADQLNIQLQKAEGQIKETVDKLKKSEDELERFKDALKKHEDVARVNPWVPQNRLL